MKRSRTPILTVMMYRRGKKLYPAKMWDRYMTMWHGQYDGGGCYHYQVPDDMVAAAESIGARRLTGPDTCEFARSSDGG
jgi:hypothetical protein